MINNKFSEPEKKQAIAEGMLPEDIELAEKTIQAMRTKAAARSAYADNIAKNVTGHSCGNEEILHHI